jgi:extracellular factor (EF) 3-hydroxypalmitic acid methyl ester biosynthesis protein
MFQELDPIFDEAFARLTHQPTVDVIDELAETLAEVHDRAKAEGLTAAFKKACQQHALAKLILEDPYSRRAFEKPRGYAGDALMLDYVYRGERVETSAAGGIIHRATTTSPNAKILLWRRDYLAEHISAVAERRRNARVLSVASGHMRELDIVRSKTEHRDIQLWALDQDGQSLDECTRSYPDFDIRPLNKSISFIFRNILKDEFDLIYSAGLSDYLPDKTMETLIRQLYNLLNEDGLLMIGNFAPDSHGRGFMEAFMDWSLTYRSEADLVRIAEEAVPKARAKTFRDGPGNVAYIEIRN